MSKTPRALVRRLTVLLCAAATVGACAHAPAAKAPAPVAVAAAPARVPAALILLPVDVARAAQVATFVAPTLDRALETGIALARAAAPLPLEPAAVREMALGQLGIPPEVGRQLDLAGPISGAVVGFGHNEAIKAAFSFTVKEGVDFGKLVATLGTVVGRRGTAFEIDTPSNGHAWFLPVGRTILFAESEAALVQAGNLALAARRASKDDLSIVVFPDALARAMGTDVKTAIEQFLGEIDARAATGASQLGPEARLQLHELFAMAADLETAEFALKLDVGKGVAILARLRSKAGSKLEELSSNVLTVPIDPLLFGKGDAGLALTSAYPARTLDQFRRLRAALTAKEKQAAKPAGKNSKDLATAGRLLDALTDGLVGTASMVGRLHPTLSAELAYPIKDAAAAKKVEAALLGVDRAAVLAMLDAQGKSGGVDVKVPTVRRETVGKLRAMHWNVTFTMANDTLGLMKKLMGGNGLDAYAAVLGDRLVITTGPGAKARLLAMATAPKTTATDKAKPAGKDAKANASPSSNALVEASALAGPRSLYYYVDLREALGLATTLGGATADPRLRMLSAALKVPIPVLGGVTGDAPGHVLTLDLTIPPSCLAGIGSIVGAVLGSGISPAGAGKP